MTLKTFNEEMDHEDDTLEMNNGDGKNKLNKRKASLRKQPQAVLKYIPTEKNQEKIKRKQQNGKLLDRWVKHFQTNILDEPTL